MNKNAVIGREKRYWEDKPEFDWLTASSIRKIIGLMPVPAGDVVELCCGSGMFTRYMPATYASYTSYTCLDLSQKLLDRLSSTLPGITVMQGNAEEPDFPDDRFDGVYIFAGLHHLPHLEKTIHNAYRILKKAGKFICFEPNSDCLYRKPMLPLRKFLGLYTEDERFLKPGDVAAVMKNSGFQNLETHFITPEYRRAHLHFVNRLLARMMYLASSFSSSRFSQSFFIITGEK